MKSEGGYIYPKPGETIDLREKWMDWELLYDYSLWRAYQKVGGAKGLQNLISYKNMYRRNKHGKKL